MSKKLLEQAKAIVAGAKKRDAQGVRASVYRSRNSEVEWRDGKVDRLRQSTSMGLSISLFVNGRYSSNSTSDLRPAAIEKFLDDTIAMTRVLAKDDHRKLPEPRRYENRHKEDLQIFDKPSDGQDAAVKRRKTAAALEDAARSAEGSDQIISVTSSCSESSGESALITSNGMQGTRQSSSFSLFLEVSVKDEKGRKPEGWQYAVCRKRKDMPAVESLGRDATLRALRDRGAKPEKSGEYACVIENRVVGRVLGGLLAPLSGNAIQQKRSFLADKIDKQITSPFFNLTDDPHILGGLGSRTYDGEGMSTAKRNIFESGILKNFYLDTYYASKLGLEPTSGSKSNLEFSRGGKDLAGLLAAMDKGILITGFSGGNSNAATGDFSVGIKGHWIEGGQIKRPISEMNLSGNHLEFWKKLAEAGMDSNQYSSTRSPSLRFNPVQFSGS